MPKAPQSGDYVSIDNCDSDSGDDTEYHDQFTDRSVDNKTALERQRDGISQPLRDPSLDQRQRRRSLMEEDGDALTLDVPPVEEQGEKDKPITWMSLVRLFLWHSLSMRFTSQMESLTLRERSRMLSS